LDRLCFLPPQLPRRTLPRCAVDDTNESRNACHAAPPPAVLKCSEPPAAALAVRMHCPPPTFSSPLLSQSHPNPPDLCPNKCRLSFALPTIPLSPLNSSSVRWLQPGGCLEPVFSPSFPFPSCALLPCSFPDQLLDLEATWLRPAPSLPGRARGAYAWMVGGCRISPALTKKKTTLCCMQTHPPLLLLHCPPLPLPCLPSRPAWLCLLNT